MWLFFINSYKEINSVFNPYYYILLFDLCILMHDMDLFKWHGLVPLVSQISSLSRDHTLKYFMNTNSCIPTMMRYSNRVMHRVISCPKLVWGSFWKLPTNGVDTAFSWHEPNWHVMNRSIRTQNLAAINIRELTAIDTA